MDVRQKAMQRQKKLDAEAKKMRKQVKVMEKSLRKAAKIDYSHLPSYRHNFKLEKRAMRENRMMAAMQAQMMARNESRWQKVEDFAFFKFTVQRESYVRYEVWTSELLGRDRAKLFDIAIHLSTPGGQEFSEPEISFPLREIHRRHYWTPKWRPYRPAFVTDGSKAVGEIPIDRARRFLAATAKLFARKFEGSRFIKGPSQAFLTMRTESGEDAASSTDVAAPQKAINGKKRRQNRDKLKQAPAPAKSTKTAVDIFADYYHDPDEWSIASDSDTGSNWGDPDPSEETPPATSSAGSELRILSKKKQQAAEKLKKKKDKKTPTFAAYVEYDDPTQPTAADIAEAKHADWHERYIRGDTLYWQQDSLTKTLTTSLYFDDSYVTPASPHPESLVPDSRHSDLYFDKPLERSNSSDSSWLTVPETTLYFSEHDVSASTHSNDISSLISSGESIYFESTSISSKTTTDFSAVISKDSDSLYYLSVTPPDTQDLGYFDTRTSSVTSSIEFTSSDTFSPRSQSSSFYEDGGHCYASSFANDTSLYGNPSMGISYLE